MSPNFLWIFNMALVRRSWVFSLSETSSNVLLMRGLYRSSILVLILLGLNSFSKHNLLTTRRITRSRNEILVHSILTISIVTSRPYYSTDFENIFQNIFFCNAKLLHAPFLLNAWETLKQKTGTGGDLIDWQYFMSILKQVSDYTNGGYANTFCIQRSRLLGKNI